MSGAPVRGRIEIRGLTRRFGARTAVHPFDADVGPGGITGLLGPNGSGKSTLLRMLLGLVRPDAGDARVDGAPLVGDGLATRRRATYMPGEIALYGERSGRDQLRWLVAGRDAGAFARAEALALELGLPLERRVRGYSHGMKRQLLFASAMAPDVRVRVLDEPTEGLDPSRRGQVLDVLREEARRGVTVLFSSHHLGEVERACERVLFLKDGRLLDEEQARGLRERAGRLARLRFDAPLDAARVSAALAAAGLAPPRALAAGVRELTLELAGPSARAALRALLALEALPEPRSVVYGELSLAELYRVLYGTEGV